MSNQPPIRPWFRLSSIRTAAAPAPAHEPRHVFSIPTFRSTSSVPSSPHTQPTKPSEPTPPPSSQPQSQPQPQSHIAAANRGSAPSSPDKRVVHAPSSSLPTSPIQKAPLINTNTNTNTNTSSVPSSPLSHKQPNTSSSPKTIKADSVYNSPNLSPNIKLTTPPPSPLILPHSQFNFEPKIPKEAEQKTMLVQKTVEKPKKWVNGNGTELHREEGNHGNTHHGKGKESETNDRGSYKKFSHLDSEDSGMNVITIAGENRGAYMELVHSQKKHEANYLHKKGNGSKTNADVVGGESESSSRIEGSANRKEKNDKGRTKSSFPMAAYMNSNVQCVNNSLLYHASCSHHDPGVRLSLSKKSHGEGYHFKEGVDRHNS
ncbi:hypothetical protein TanjilG_29241 [Lupinus angustifolius]|uniref:Uncharacterized protein n=1 Tax=Lupinus angustifolius TaxID=3871 RepID=A0A1J7HLG8_LUPAN|nr:PREDICTED: mucin-5AC-like [Lupinus angustifolius]OIW13500.1 hypothetical protein TanjilG_29241 [Lupinus angustifolius]